MGNTGQPSARGTPPGFQRASRLAVRSILVVAVVLSLSGPAAAAPELAEPAPFPQPLRPVAAPPPGIVRPGGRGVELPVPAVTVRVRVPARVAAGEELTYRMEVVNCSRASAHHVTLRVTVPAGSADFVRAAPEPEERAPVLVWKLGTLAACARRDVTLVVRPTGLEEVACCARIQFEHGQCVRTRVGDRRTVRPPAPERRTTPPPVTPSGRPVLQLRRVGPMEAALYDIFHYKLEVKNVGTAPARDVVVRDNLAKGINVLKCTPAEASSNPLFWKLGDLAPGRTQVIDCEVVAKESGTQTSTAGVEAAGLARQETTHTIRIGESRLVVSKSGPRERGVNRLTTYHLSVVNTGDLVATNVQLVDELKPEIEFIRASGGGQIQGSQVRWGLGTLEPGARRTVQLVVRARQPGEFRNVCTVTADRGLVEQSRATTTFSEPTGLSVEIDPESNPAGLDQPISVVVRVRNAGKTPETNVRAIITLPEGLRLIDLPLVKGHEIKGRQVLLPPRALAAGEESYVTLRVQGEKAGAAALGVTVGSDRVAPDRAIRVEETITFLTPARSTSRKPFSTW